MKDRSGTVGATGVAKAVRTLRARYPSLRIHVVGHSLGGRLAASCAKALADSTEGAARLADAARGGVLALWFQRQQRAWQCRVLPRRARSASRQGPVPVDVLRRGHRRRQGLLGHVASRRRQHERRSAMRATSSAASAAMDHCKTTEVATTRLNRAGTPYEFKAASSTILTARADSSRTMAT